MAYFKSRVSSNLQACLLKLQLAITIRMGPTPVNSNKSKNQYFQHFRTETRHGKEVLVTQITMRHPHYRQRWQKTVDQLRRSNDIYILIPNQYHVVEKGMCGSAEILEIEYPPFEITLTQFIQDKLQKEEHFEQSELWFVLFNLLQVGNRCNGLGSRIGDVRPENILLNKAQQMKVLTYLSFPNEFNTFMQKDPKNYFSPEEIEELRKGCIQNLTDPVKSESFSIGLTVLSMALLHGMSQLYKAKNNELKFDNIQLEGYLQNFQAITYSKLQGKQLKYSSSIIEAISQLLRLNPDQRMSYISLYKQLTMFAQNIQGFQTFQVQIKNAELKSPAKQVITLCSRQKKNKNQVSPTAKQSSSPFRPIVQSRYVGGDFKVDKSPVTVLALETDLLKKIDEKLKQSRQQFPS